MATSAVPPHRAGHLLKRVVFRTDDVMVSFWQVLIWPNAGSTVCAPAIGRDGKRDGFGRRGAPQAGFPAAEVRGGWSSSWCRG